MKDRNEDEFDRLVGALARRIAPVVRRELIDDPARAAIRGLFSALDAAEADIASARGHAECLGEFACVTTEPPP